MKKLISYFVEHSAVANWLMILLLVGGVFALSQLETRVNPKMEIEEVEVDIAYPGASALEVEEGLVIKIEESLQGVEGIERIVGQARDGWASVDVEITPGYDMNKAIQNVKNAVNSISAYPTGAERPVIRQETMWNRAIMFTISGEQELTTLKKIAEEFRDELYATGKVSSVRWWGTPDREFSIEVSPHDLIRYGLTIDEVANAVRNYNINISAGSVLTDQEEIKIRSYNKKYEAFELEGVEIVSKVDGQKIRLTDVATIREQWPENRFFSEYMGRKSIGFNVMYNNNEDVVEIVELVDRKIEEFRAKYPTVNFEPLIRDTDDLEERIALMTQNGLLGLLLVILTLTVFLNSRLAFWVSLSIPISLMGMFFVLWTLDITINEMSLFGMILVIGILVDDGIIVGESIYSQWERGKGLFKAAVDGTLDVLTPVTVSIITTIVAFVPYFYFYGMVGKNVRQIAAVVIISLLFSLVEAALILPAHLAHSKLRAPSHASPHFFERLRARIDGGIRYWIENVYGKFLAFSLRNRWAVAATVFASVLLILGIFQGAHVRSQFFPEIEPPFTRVQIETPAGVSALVADDIRDRVVDDAMRFGKQWAAEHGDTGNAIQGYTSWMNGGTINIFMVLPSSAIRDYSVGAFSDALAEHIGDVPEAENIVVGGWNFGGKPISIRLQSPDYSQLMKAKELLKDEIRNIEGVKNIQDDTPIGGDEFVVDLKPKGKALGFTVADLTRQLRQGFYGQEVMRLQRGRDELKVWVRYNKQDRVSIGQIENLKVRTPDGEYVPFKEVADYSIQPGILRIRHENLQRAVQVYADLDFAKNDLSLVLQDLDEDILPRVLAQVDGVRKSNSGQAEEMEKIVASIQFSMAIALVIMFSILMMLLRSYLQTALIVSLIPLGVVGAVMGHLIVDIPVSILSFLGIVALAGIIINDSVVLVDRYNRFVRQGTPVFEALLAAGKARFRAITLTTITTAAGLAPIIFLQSEQGQFLVPMAVSVAFGLLYGSFLCLVALPSTLYLLSDFRLALAKLRKSGKSRAELEPSYSKPSNE
jgi:multidrug efflux pump subunit AcrB